MRKIVRRYVAMVLLLVCFGMSINAWADDDATEMYRLYNPNSGEHFYTASTTERDALATIGWSYEGVGWVAPNAGTPVYRLYNKYAGDHHYTSSMEERVQLVNVGWTYEGIGWFSDTNKTVPLYRQYNPYAVAGAHNYTTSAYENSYLVSLGWRAEGIGWYGVAEGRAAFPGEMPTPKPSVPQPKPDDAEEAEPSHTDQTIYYWTPYGHIYHTSPNCPAIVNSPDKYSGTLEDYVKARGNEGRACKYCS